MPVVVVLSPEVDDDDDDGSVVELPVVVDGSTPIVVSEPLLLGSTPLVLVPAVSLVPVVAVVVPITVVAVPVSVASELDPEPSVGAPEEPVAPVSRVVPPPVVDDTLVPGPVGPFEACVSVPLPSSAQPSGRRAQLNIIVMATLRIQAPPSKKRQCNRKFVDGVAGRHSPLQA